MHCDYVRMLSRQYIHHVTSTSRIGYAIPMIKHVLKTVSGCFNVLRQVRTFRQSISQSGYHAVIGCIAGLDGTWLPVYYRDHLPHAVINAAARLILCVGDIILITFNFPTYIENGTQSYGSSSSWTSSLTITNCICDYSLYLCAIILCRFEVFGFTPRNATRSDNT